MTSTSLLDGRRIPGIVANVIRRWKTVLTLALTVTALLALIACQEDSPQEEENIPLGLNEADMKMFSKISFGGYLVWERKRNQSWEIWSKKLSGGKEKRLVPSERGRDHFCPQVSPDGKYLAYMSYARGENAYPMHRNATGSLWIMNINKRKRSKVVAKARSYAEDRAVVWMDNKRICYIDENGVTKEMNLLTRATRTVLKKPETYFGYLPSPDLRHATSGTPEFAVMDAGAQTIQPNQRIAGCQPFFTRDSQWGYWMGGAGGPMNKINLATREISQIMKKDDKRLHGKRNYIYFPMISSCQRLLAFAASEDAHDHFDSNYDIYVAHLHPKLLNIIGIPVRYTKHPGCDRFPDVFRKELPLGTHYVEGPTEIEFKAPKGSGEWRWHIQGGINDEGTGIKHTFAKPGEYWVDAKQGAKRLRGYVYMRAGTPPEVEAVQRVGDRGLTVDFNESVDALATAKVTLERTGESIPWTLRQENFTLEIELPEGVTDEDSLVVSGFQDRAQRPNLMLPATVEIPGTQWPASDEGLVFVWEGRDGRATLPNGTPCDVVPRGLAYWDQNGAMQLRGGWFDAPNAGELISSECRKSNAFTAEFLVTSKAQKHPLEFHPILTLAKATSAKNLSIGQTGNRLTIRLRTTSTGTDARTEETHLANIDPDRPHHLLVSYSKDKLMVYLDGNRLWGREKLEGNFSNWEDMTLRFGAAIDGARPWRGSIERVCVYNRQLSEKEITEHANASIVEVGQRKAPQEWVVQARLKEVSQTPTLQEFQPYTEGLVRHLYEVVSVQDGSPLLPDKEIAVAQWSWMNSTAMPAQKLKEGDVVTLRLQRAEDHPELTNLFTRDDLISNFDAERFVDVSEWDMEYVKP